jgi:opacity protein-like surface antigen
MRPTMRAPAMFALVALCALALAPRASAQPSWELTPFAGYYLASDIYNSYYTSGAGTTNVGLTNSFLFGGRLTRNLGAMGVELAYTRTGSDVELNNVLVGQPRAHLGKIDIDTFDLNFLGYQHTNNPNVLPFGEVGLGFSVVHPKIDQDFVLASTPEPDSRTNFQFNFGLGTKIAISEQIGARIEGRWRITDTNFNTSSGLWCDPWGYCYNYASSWYNSGELIGGLSYRF